MSKTSRAQSWTQPAGSPATRSRSDNEWEKARGFLELRVSDARYALYGTADRAAMEEVLDAERRRILPEHEMKRIAARQKRAFLTSMGCSSVKDAARIQTKRVRQVSSH